MARYHNIEMAFRAAIKFEPKGRRTVKTEDFCAELAKNNLHWTQREANRWIERYVLTFRDITPHEGEDRLFILFNPNGGL